MNILRKRKKITVSVPQPLVELMWKCHVCGKERPDAAISVHKSVKVVRGVKIAQNVRYCNDRNDCILGAVHIDFVS